MAAGISFSQFNIVSGIVREDGPYVAVLEDRVSAEAAADLYVVLEPAWRGSEPFCPELLKLIDGHFGRPEYSLTGNLLQALRVAQQHLHAWNKTCRPEQRAAVGASCLIVSGNEAYLGQLGPGIAYVRHQGHLRRLQPVEPESQEPVGASMSCSPCFRRFELGQGDTLLLASSRYGELVDDATTDLVLSLPPGEALPQIFRFARQEHEFSALYLAVTGALVPAEVRESEDARGVLVDGGSVVDQRDGYGRRPRGNAPGAMSGLPAETRAAVVVGRRSRPAAGGAAYQQAGQPRGSAADRRRALGQLSGRHSPPVPKPALYAAVSVVTLLVAGWLSVPRLVQTGKQDRFAALMHDAQVREQSALVQHDTAKERQLLEKSQADLGEAKLLRPTDQSVASLGSEIVKALDTLNGVRQFPAATTLVDLSATSVAPSAATDLVVGAQIYLLDGSTGRVYAFDPSGQPAGGTVVFQGQKTIESMPTGPAQHLAMQPGVAGRPGLLYILDSNRRLFSLDSSGTLRSVGLVATDRWKSAAAIAVTATDLYVLDGAGNQIWRYQASNGGYTSTPARIASKIDLHDATQIAVPGDIYVSTLKGRLVRFSGGREQEMQPRGIDRPLVSPQPPVVDPQPGLLYIADAGNDRIVVMDANGTFKMQYVGSALHGLRSIALDPNSGLLYALSEQSLISSRVR